MTSAGTALLAWYDAEARPLPWRESADPYRVWLSEIMLQQTRVETVLPYYERFLDRFPTVETLAAAELEEVLALWSGLGYYRRARQLHGAARKVVELGAFPGDRDGLLALPGIGPYTAAAVASIAFGEVVPVLDGNVERVLSRWLASSEDPKSAAGRKRLLATAAGFLAEDRPGDSNQALMELGARLCLPRRPRCLLCPLASSCRARVEGDPELYPVAKPKRQPQRIHRRVAVSSLDGRVLLFRRPDSETLLAGTWELPWVDDQRSRKAAAAALAERYGGSWRLRPACGEVRHSITFRALRVSIHPATLEGGDELREGPEAGWFGAEERRRLPLSSLVDKVLERFAAEGR